MQELSAYLISSPCSERGNCALDIYFKECLVWHMRQSSALEGNIVFVLWYLQVKQTSFIINVCHGSMVQWSSLYCQSFACWDTFHAVPFVSSDHFGMGLILCCWSWSLVTLRYLRILLCSAIVGQDHSLNISDLFCCISAHCQLILL